MSSTTNNSPTEPLKDVVREKIAEPSLNDAQLAELNTRVSPEFSQKKPWSNLMIAAGLLFLLGLSLMAHTQWQNWNKEKLFIAIAQDTVDEHIKPRALEFRSQNLAELDQHFSELAFTLVNSIQVPNLNQVLLGGSYSVIQGLTAAHLQLQTSDAQTSSLFQIPFGPENFSKLGDINVDEQPALRYVKGLSVTIWEEKGVLLVQVQAPETDTLGSGIQRPQLTPPETH